MFFFVLRGLLKLYLIQVGIVKKERHTQNFDSHSFRNRIKGNNLITTKMLKSTRDCITVCLIQPTVFMVVRGIRTEMPSECAGNRTRAFSHLSLTRFILILLSTNLKLLPHACVIDIQNGSCCRPSKQANF